MEYRDLSKLQIKAEITLMLKKFNSVEEMSREQQINYISKFGSIKNRDYLIEILAKELGRVNYQKGQVISIFLQEFGTLEQVKDILWSYIKNPGIKDEIKDISGVILKNMGDETDPEEFLNYLEDPKLIVDKETKKLLEIACVNPEAQIDFLDFLFSLPETEQFNLVQSLREDYSCEHIVNVVVPAFESRLATHMDEFFVEVLGESRSLRAVMVLQDVLLYSKDEKLTKKARISLNKLKLAGIETEDIESIEQNQEIAKVSGFYECHTNIPDGMGNQAVIFSRIKPNGDILMMNLIINDTYGILDCFGFYGISKDDFRRIIERFQDRGTRFLVSPEYGRYIIEQAEKINKTKSSAIPYEYIAWKSAIKDIKYHDLGEDKLVKKWSNKELLEKGELLHKFPDFDKWFFEPDDHEAIKDNIDRIINELCDKKVIYKRNPDKLVEDIENEINYLFPVIFDDCVRKVYRKRLENVAVLFNITELEHFRDIAATLASAIDSGSDSDIINNSFLRGIIKKTVFEGLLRYEYDLYNREQQKLNPWNVMKAEKNKEIEESQTDEPKQSIQELIEILFERQADKIT